jgi:hypothetical protein
VKYLDWAALAGMGLGFALMMSSGMLQAGFFVTLASTVLHIFTSHSR